MEMLIASVVSHICLGALLAVFFVLYYVHVDGKWKTYVEMLIGFGGNGCVIFLLDSVFNIQDIIVRMWSIASCIFSFLFVTLILLIVISRLIKDKDDNDVLRLRDILFGQTSWINKYYEVRAKEIDERLNIPQLEVREQRISEKENKLAVYEKYLNDEKDAINTLGNKKVRLFLPENTNITLTKDYIEVMPSYFRDMINCIQEMSYYEAKYLENSSMNYIQFQAYLISIATCISTNIFNGNSSEIRIHFRFYNKSKKGYDKLIAIIGRKIVENNMTFIPYEDDNMILKSYECKRALIKSINCEHDYQSSNYKVWKDYLTYTFYNLETDGIPFLSFGISIKNEVRYKKIFYFLNYIKFEEYLQEKIEAINTSFKIESILYGGN